MRLLLLFSFLMTLAAANPVFAQPVIEEEEEAITTDEYNDMPQSLLMAPDNANVPVKIPETINNMAGEDVMSMDDIVIAYNKGQYELAASRILPLANSNYPLAQELLGIMYRNGQGVPKDPEAAIEWLTKAADTGRALAQHHLAIIAYTGDGMPPDPVKALSWLHIAIGHYPEGPDKERAKQDRENVSAQLSRRDRDRAYDMAREWLQAHNEEALLATEKKH